MQRIKSVVVNASRCSHSELDNATVLDDGDPTELGRLIGRLHSRFPHFNVFGGCCGTDMRHMQQIANCVTNIPG
jgi:homocysteine S-methyltransferase